MRRAKDRGWPGLGGIGRGAKNRLPSEPPWPSLIARRRRNFTFWIFFSLFACRWKSEGPTCGPWANVVTAIGDMRASNTMIDRGPGGGMARLPRNLGTVDRAFRTAWPRIQPSSGPGKSTLDTSRLYYGAATSQGRIHRRRARCRHWSTATARLIRGVAGDDYRTAVWMLQRGHRYFGRGTPDEGRQEHGHFRLTRWLVYNAYPKRGRDRQLDPRG